MAMWLLGACFALIVFGITTFFTDLIEDPTGRYDQWWRVGGRWSFATLASGSVGLLAWNLWHGYWWLAGFTVVGFALLMVGAFMCFVIAVKSQG